MYNKTPTNHATNLAVSNCKLESSFILSCAFTLCNSFYHIIPPLSAMRSTIKFDMSNPLKFVQL